MATRRRVRSFHALHCATCHEGSGEGAGLHQKLALETVRDKFAPGALAEFLRKPDRHFASIAMPDFKLTDDEAAALAAWLESRATTPPADAPRGDATRGEVLVQERGCLACHASALTSKYAGAPAFADLAATGVVPALARLVVSIRRRTSWRPRSVRLFRPLHEPTGARWRVRHPPSSPPRSLPG